MAICVIVSNLELKVAYLSGTTCCRHMYPNGISEPDGAAIEDCTAIHLQQLQFHKSWKDVPCAINSYNSFICEQQTSSGKLGILFIIITSG